MRTRKHIIGVIGSGSHPFFELSQPLGRWIADQGFHLLNGGGGGVMQAVAEAYKQNESTKGMVIGVLPSDSPCENSEGRKSYKTPEGYPNPFIDIPIATHLPLSGNQGKETQSRNHIVVLSADFIVALPGSEGTASEIGLTLEYKKPHAILNAKGAWESFRSQKARLVDTLDEVFALIQMWNQQT